MNGDRDRTLTTSSLNPLSSALIPRESISSLGYIQSHGVLLVVNPATWEIVQISQNAQCFWGKSYSYYLNQSLNLLFNETAIDSLKTTLKTNSFPAIIPLEITNLETEKTENFDALAYQNEAGIVIELERNMTGKRESFIDFYHRLKASELRIRKAADLQELCQVTVEEIRRLTGLDRVMLYRFNEKGNGTVLAEEKRPNLKSFLGLNFPALDIPEAARQLFCEIGLRTIVDINAAPSPILPELNPITQRPLNLSHSVLRGVSPCHIQYLKNMGVVASLSIPLIKDNRLWGLIACHHNTPKFFAADVRAACELLGRSVSAELAAKKNSEDYDYQIKINSLQAQLAEYMSTEDNWVTGLAKYNPNLLDLASATGAAIWIDGACTLVGETPPQEAIAKLIDWLIQNHSGDRVIDTDSLYKLDRDYEQYKAIASGMLAVSLSENKAKYILWFRPEVIQTVTWAGDPKQSLQEDENGNITLSPRQSFELWKEAVRFTSLPWKPCEIEAAQALRSAIHRLTLRRADKLAQLNQALQESEAREREKATQLEATLAELQKIHTRLVQTHTQLIQSEKMSSLGQLVAGVAHEINNPVNFIYGNLMHMEEYIEDILDVLKLYSDHYPEPVEEIADIIEEIELDFLMEDLPKMLGSMKVGSSRIREIVQSLRNFSRLDESEVKPVNIHEGLDSTLLILNNRIKARSDRPALQVIKKYGKLPLIECYPGPLNQVFMNLLVNAIDAIEDYNRDRAVAEIRQTPGTIMIQTDLYDNPATGEPWTKIVIADSGAGIATDAQNRLFDPFYTTKPIGKGTGMGLAISYQIITEKHGGILSCYSQPGQGAAFAIEIPVRAACVQSESSVVGAACAV